jgi:hypothetical protein
VKHGLLAGSGKSCPDIVPDRKPLLKNYHSISLDSNKNRRFQSRIITGEKSSRRSGKG